MLERLAVALGLPERTAMKATVIDQELEGDLVVNRVAYLWAGQTYVSATVIYSSEGEGRRPAVVIPSGWKGHYTFRAYRSFVDQLAHHGFLVLFIDDPRTGLRQSPPAGLYATASATGTPVAGIQVFDALRALDYLRTRTDVEPSQIGIAGLEEGALCAYLAAALEPRFQFTIAVGGTTTYRALVHAAGPGRGLEDPSAFVFQMLYFADMDRIAGCLAPRPVLIAGDAQNAKWPDEGRSAVQRTMTHVYRLFDATDKIRHLPGKAMDDCSPYEPAIVQWLEDRVLPSLDSSSDATLPVEEPGDLDFSMLRWGQQQVANQAADLDIDPNDPKKSREVRRRAADWLAETATIADLRPPADDLQETSESDGLVTERLALGIDGSFRCPAILIRSTASDKPRRAAVVLSHDDRQSAASTRILDAAKQLAVQGHVVIVPDHASVDPPSAQPLVGEQGASFYGDDAARFYGPAGSVGITPLSLRVADTAAAVAHLASRRDVDPKQITVAGIGFGSLDACLVAALDTRVAGLAMVDATTMRSWSSDDAPGTQRFFNLIPSFPGLLRSADFDILATGVAPRPLALVRLKGGWPSNGFDQFAASVATVYGNEGADAALLALGPREVVDQLDGGSVDGTLRQILLAARTLMPTPPQAGVVGTPEGLKSRRTVDSATGLIWIVEEMDGYEQELTDNGFQITQWSFFNDNRAAQQGRLVTPVILKMEEDRFVITGVGKTRANDGSGLQSFPFEPVQGTDLVGDRCFFGWHTGDLEGHTNPGVVEFEDAPDALMTILTVTGQMTDQKLGLGNTYRAQSQFRRRYSVMAVSKPVAPQEK